MSRISLPVLLNIADMKQAIADLVAGLNRLGTQRDSLILASMYRHLAHWPTYLALIWATLAPLDADGSLSRLKAEVLARARPRAAGLVTRLRAPSEAAMEPAVRAKIRAAVEPFAGDVIAKMVVICAMLHVASGGS